jgi:NDP-sugar pyrophosphorylase family protein
MLELKNQGIHQFTLALGHGSELVVTEVQRWQDEFDDVNWVIEPTPSGTGGALLLAMKDQNLDEFVAVNGDTLISGDISSIMSPLKTEVGELVRLGGVFVENRERFGGIEINDVGQVVKFEEKGTVSQGLINSGLYRINASAFKGETEVRFSFEHRILKNLCLSRSLYCAALKCGFIDIGIPADYKKLCSDQLFVKRRFKI